MKRSVRRRRWMLATAALVALVLGGVFAVRALVASAPVTPHCTLGSGAAALDLDPEQAANASTVAAVALNRSLPDHAVTIALATALQESKLYNVNYGDRDSLGVFQQRPSQGWGTPAQLMDPAYAAGAFLDHLAKVPGWRTMPVAEAAQRVQHSADGSAYAQWEEEARSLARALTGEVTAGLTCRYDDKPRPRPAPLATAAAAQLGPSWQAPASSPARAWATAEWLVAHALVYGVERVEVAGMRWTPASGRWTSTGSAAGLQVSYALVKATG